MDVKQEIKDLLLSVDRIDNVFVDALEGMGYFESPASTNKHLSITGGLAIHSYNVYISLKKLNDIMKLNLSEEFIIVTTLLHDICKCGCYETNYLKNGTISEVKPFKYNDTFPYGHGDKSVYILNTYFKLTNEEAMAIRYHIGPFEFEVFQRWNMVANQLKDTPYWIPIMALYHADSMATSIIEHEDYELYLQPHKYLNTSTS